MIREQDWRGSWLPWGCLVQRRSTFLVLWTCQDKGSASEALALSEMHSLGGHLKTWNNRTILLCKRKRGGSHCHKEVFHWHAEQVLVGTGNTLGCEMVTSRWGNSIYSQHHDELEWLNHRFSNWLISRRREPEWSLHSLDLISPTDFYLWGFLKNKVVENNPQSIAELKVAINQKIHAIPKNGGSEWLINLVDEFKWVTSEMVIWNTFGKKCIIWARDLKLMFF